MSNALHLHATCVSIGGKGVLLFGPSGCGKSDVALQLIDRGAKLVGDDQVMVRRGEEVLFASPSERLQGMLESRGVGILHLPNVREIPISLAVRLVARDQVERLPPPQFFDCLGLRVPLLSLHAFDNSVCAKIRAWLQYKELSL